MAAMASVAMAATQHVFLRAWEMGATGNCSIIISHGSNGVSSNGSFSLFVMTSVAMAAMASAA
eukprot:4971623-Lingulodinium_polyedra.AAC.1